MPKTSPSSFGGADIKIPGPLRNRGAMYRPERIERWELRSALNEPAFPRSGEIDGERKASAPVEVEARHAINKRSGRKNTMTTAVDHAGGAAQVQSQARGDLPPELSPSQNQGGSPSVRKR